MPGANFMRYTLILTYLVLVGFGNAEKDFCLANDTETGIQELAFEKNMTS